MTAHRPLQALSALALRVRRLDGYQWAVAAVFTLTVILRFPLAYVNRGFNDAHFPVTNRIYESGAPFDFDRLPTREDCWQCYHAKLYYWLIAALISLWPAKFVEAHLVVAQLINAGFGLLTVTLIWLYVWRTPYSNREKFFAFSLAALNPGLIAIGAQYTNDAAVIFCSTAALYATSLFLDSRRAWHFTVGAAFAFLAMNFKTSGLVAAIIIGCALAIRVAADRGLSLPPGRRYLPYLAIFVIAIPLLGLASPFTQYLTNSRKYGTPIPYNIPRPPAARLFLQTPDNHPGIRSVADGFFTFHLIDLLQHPHIVNARAGYTVHRTSFWSLLYGRAHSAHFDAWPPEWADSGWRVQSITRAIFVLGLFPSAMVMMGFAAQAASGARALWRRTTAGSESSALWFWPLTFASYIGFLAALTYLYRHYQNVKFIYIGASLIAAAALYLPAAAYVHRRWPRLARLTNLAQIVLLILYVADILTLTHTQALLLQT